MNVVGRWLRREKVHFFARESTPVAEAAPTDRLHVPHLRPSTNSNTQPDQSSRCQQSPQCCRTAKPCLLLDTKRDLNTPAASWRSYSGGTGKDLPRIWSGQPRSYYRNSQERTQPRRRYARRPYRCGDMCVYLIGQIEEEIARNLNQMKITLQGTPGEPDPQPDAVYQVVQHVLAESLLPLLVENIHRLPFEARKDTQAIISNVFRFRNPGSTSPEPDALKEVLRRQPEIVVSLCNGYDRRESASPCGGILKEALKWDAVAAVILYDEPAVDGKRIDIYSDVDVTKPSSGRGVFWSFFSWIDKSSFEVSADAFDCFRLLLTKHKQLVSQYISTNFDLFFDRYNNTLIKSESYVTKRQSLKLLGEILLDRQFYEVMTRYVSSGNNLKLIMYQLKDDRKMVQYEAFHVFKIFAANPNKSYEVQKFLIMNKQRLLKFLPRFLEERTEDEQFNDEKAWLVKAIGTLPDSTNGIRTAPPAANAQTAAVPP